MDPKITQTKFVTSMVTLAGNDLDKWIFQISILANKLWNLVYIVSIYISTTAKNSRTQYFDLIFKVQAKHNFSKITFLTIKLENYPNRNI